MPRTANAKHGPSEVLRGLVRNVRECFRFHVVLFQERRRWFAHALECDVVVDAGSKAEVIDSIMVAVKELRDHAVAAKSLDTLFSPAPAEMWFTYAKIPPSGDNRSEPMIDVVDWTGRSWTQRPKTWPKDPTRALLALQRTMSFHAIAYREGSDWLGHVLETDTVSAPHDSALEALSGAQSALRQLVADACDHKDLSTIYSPAPYEVWEQFADVSATNFKDRFATPAMLAFLPKLFVVVSS